MIARVTSRLKRRPFLSAALALCLAAGLWFALSQLHTWWVWSRFLQQVEAVEQGEPGSIETHAWSFAFLDTTCTVEADVRRGELERARAIDTSAVFGTRLWLRAGYVSNLVRLQAESGFVSDLAGEFRRLRKGMDLDDDEYVELLATAVQSITYGDVADEILLPIEVAADGKGVCSEKSILLAALLLHEEYDTCVWVFETQGHAAVGVASDAAHFRGTDYAFLETTRFAFVGQVSEEYDARGPIAKPPEMIRVGGSRSYGAGHEVEFITRRLREADILKTAWRAYPEFATRDIERHKVRYAQRAEEHGEATGLGAWVMENTHRREAVYRELARLVSEAEDR